MKNADVKLALAPATGVSAADILEVTERLAALINGLDEHLREPISVSNRAASPHIRRAPLLRPRFE